MSICSHRFSSLIGCLWLALVSTSVSALKPENITPAELALLPRYCRDSQTFVSIEAFPTLPATANWIARMGKGFYHIHHHCWALINYQRALSPRMSRYNKSFLLKDVRGDFWYVVNNTDSSFVLLPEIYTWIGRTSVLLEEPHEAITAFTKAKTLKPDYWPPYYHWAELLRTRGKKSEALEVLRAGLQYSPTAKALLALYGELGGKPGDIPPPPPIVKADEAEQQPAAPAPAESSSPPAADSQNKAP